MPSSQYQLLANKWIVLLHNELFYIWVLRFSHGKFIHSVYCQSKASLKPVLYWTSGWTLLPVASFLFSFRSCTQESHTLPDKTIPERVLCCRHWAFTERIPLALSNDYLPVSLGGNKSSKWNWWKKSKVEIEDWISPLHCKNSERRVVKFHQ